MACSAEGAIVFKANIADGQYAELCVDNATLFANELGYVLEVPSGTINFEADAGNMWLIVAGAMVFLMQAGFAMLEAGSVRSKNTINILFKNLLDASIGALMFWAVGYAFATGDSAGYFIGTTKFFLLDGFGEGEYASFFFQWAFAATAATIVSGSVAERTKLSAYFVYSFFITGFVYPVVVHWGWNGGFLSAWDGSVPALLGDGSASADTADYNGLIDFAGSGVVHMVGGFAGLVGAAVVGPRAGRFSEETSAFFPFGKPQDIPGHSLVLSAMGVIILWFGWFGFNAGSTLCTTTCMPLAARVATTTTLAAAAAAVTVTFTVKLVTGTFDLARGLNGVIAGLVSITASCSVVSPAMSIPIGVIGGLVYLVAEYALLAAHVDDPLGAAPLHGFCGAWGLLSVAAFGTDDDVTFAAYPNTPNNAIASGNQAAIQAIGVFAIMGWTIATSLVIFLGIKYTIGMRVDEETEEYGLDASEHKGAAYNIQ